MLGALACGVRRTNVEAPQMISEIPLTCPQCGKRNVKPVDWIQQNTFFTCAFCNTSVMIDKDHAAQVLAAMETQRHQ